MKHIILTLAILFSAYFAHAGGGSTVTTPITVVDAERAAAEFVSRVATYYRGSSYLEQTAVNGSFTWVWTQFNLQQGKITQMTMYSTAYPDGIEIVVPKGGFSGFPRNTVGQTRNFRISLEGHDDANEFVSYGSFETPLFKINDQIVVTLSPSSRLVKKSFPRSAIPAGVDPNNLTLQYGNTWTTWSSYFESFWLYIDPLTDGEWILFDRSTGFRYPFDPTDANTASAYAGVSIKYVGGAVKLDWIDSMVYLAGQFLDSVITRADQMVAAKTYFTALDGDGMTIFAANLNGTVEIFSVDPDGKRTLVKSETVVAADWNNVVLDAGYDKVLVTLTGTITYDGGFQVQMFRQPPKGIVYGGGYSTTTGKAN